MWFIVSCKSIWLRYRVLLLMAIHKVSGRKWRLSPSDRRLYYSRDFVAGSYTQCVISDHVSHTLWMHQILEHMRRFGRRFCIRVKLLTMGYTACIAIGGHKSECHKSNPHFGEDHLTTDLIGR